MATDWEGVLPQGVAQNILTATEEASVVLGLATTRPMADGWPRPPPQATGLLRPRALAGGRVRLRP
jgi:hypothetical protein